MTISDTQKIDLLYKKLAWGVAKTDTNPPKDAPNESIASPLLIRGDLIWQDSGSIPASIPSSSSSIVQVYKDNAAGSWTQTVQTTVDNTSTTNRTWTTGLTDWIPVEFGSTYFVKVYADTTGSTTAQTTGTQLGATGASGSSADEWFFDYQSGVLNFIGTNLPSALTVGKSIFISGARYIGGKGYSQSNNNTNTNIITSDIFNADGNTNTFTISQNNTTSGTLVTINGVLQIPTSSYTVSGNVLTFNETPVSTDVIEARSFGPASAITNLYANSNVAAYLPTYTGNITAGNITVNAYINANAAIVSRLASISVGAAAVVIDTFDKTLFRSAKYVVQVSNSGRGDYESSEFLAMHDGTVAYGSSYAVVYSNVELGNVSVAVNSGNVELTYTGNYAGNIVKLFKEYIPV